MDSARDHLLAGARFPKHEHVAVETRDLLNEPVEAADDRGLTTRQYQSRSNRYPLLASFRKLGYPCGLFSHVFA
jgi:hypothetical protein